MAPKRPCLTDHPVRGPSSLYKTKSTYSSLFRAMLYGPSRLHQRAPHPSSSHRTIRRLPLRNINPSPPSSQVLYAPPPPVLPPIHHDSRIPARPGGYLLDIRLDAVLT